MTSHACSTSKVDAAAGTLELAFTTPEPREVEIELTGLEQPVAAGKDLALPLLVAQPGSDGLRQRLVNRASGEAQIRAEAVRAVEDL